MLLMMLWLRCIKTFLQSRLLTRSTLTLSRMIAVPDALAPTTFEVDADPTVHDPMAYDLPFSNDLFPAATDPLLLQPTVKDIKAAKALDVVVDVVSLPMADVVHALVHAQLALTILKKKLLPKPRPKIPHLPILVPTPKITTTSSAMNPSMLV